MSSSTTVINYARQMRTQQDTDDKLDKLSKAIEALATYLYSIEPKVDAIDNRVARLAR